MRWRIRCAALERMVRRLPEFGQSTQVSQQRTDDDLARKVTIVISMTRLEAQYDDVSSASSHVAGPATTFPGCCLGCFSMRNSPKVEGIITLLWSALLATSQLVKYSM